MLDLNSNSGIINLENLSISSRFTEITPLTSSEFGHCELFKAKRFGKWHTLKVLKKTHANNLIYQGLIQKEFQISYSLSHPNIINTIGIEDIDNLGICIIFEYIDGVTLDKYIDTSKPNNKQIIKILSELCDALDYIHGKQIIHRDIKPSNIIITHNGNNVKLIDFGLSDSDSYAVLKQPAGSYPYASPEQSQNGVTIDNRADIYALGVLIQYINSSLNESLKKTKRIISRCTDCSRSNRFSSAKQISVLLNRENSFSIFFIILISVICGMSYGYFQGASNRDFELLQIDSVKKSQNLNDKNIEAFNKIANIVTNHYNSQFDSISAKSISFESYSSYIDTYNTMYSLREKYVDELLLKDFSISDPVFLLYKSSLLKIAEKIFYDNFTKKMYYYNKLLEQQGIISVKGK